MFNLKQENTMVKVGDIVMTEYKDVGELVEINGREAVVASFNCGLKEDYTYCDVRECHLASSKEVDAARHEGIINKKSRDVAKFIAETCDEMRMGDIRMISDNAFRYVRNGAQFLSC